MLIWTPFNPGERETQYGICEISEDTALICFCVAQYHIANGRPRSFKEADSKVYTKITLKRNNSLFKSSQFQQRNGDPQLGPVRSGPTNLNATAHQPAIVVDVAQLDIGRFRVHPEQPVWMRCNVKTDVLRNLTLTGQVSISDLRKELALAFEEHLWVRKVLGVQVDMSETKPTVVVALRYQEPVMVRAEGGGHLPVTSDGVLLPPSDISGEDYAHITAASRTFIHL